LRGSEKGVSDRVGKLIEGMGRGRRKISTVNWTHVAGADSGRSSQMSQLTHGRRVRETIVKWNEYKTALTKRRRERSLNIDSKLLCGRRGIKRPNGSWERAKGENEL